MTRKFLAVFALLIAAPALAQDVDYDDRWYLAPDASLVFADSDRGTEDFWQIGLGLGKFFSRDMSTDFNLHYGWADIRGTNEEWKHIGLDAQMRYRFFPDDEWRPYLYGSIGVLHHDTLPGAESSIEGQLGVGAGVERQMSPNTRFRTELIYRWDMDEESVASQDSFTDWMIRAGLTWAMGEPRAQVEPVELAPTPVDSDGDGVTDDRDRCPGTPPGVEVDQYGCELDSDGDGVPNSKDKCPDTKPGVAVDRDGCEVQIVIELPNVNFEFDRSNLLPESTAILDRAVGLLSEHSGLKVEVAGHTDSRGAEDYNERLSDARAKVVYEYLIANGIDAERLTWRGYGESMPIDSNETDEGRAENRRTELRILSNGH